MMQPGFTLAELATCLSCPVDQPDLQVSGVCIDSRKVVQGDLFIALRGERFDGHDFIQQAIQQGAVAVVVETSQPVTVPQLVVQDAIQALGQIAAYNRSFFTGTLLAVTGSSGKTTVKEMLAAILSRSGTTLATQGNLNNHIGVPLTLLQLGPEHRYAVIEMGASGAGEIAYTAALARPDIALVNNAMDAHLQGFGSLQGVVDAKGEIYSGLSAVGVAIVNSDDNNAWQWQESIGARRTLRFSRQTRADVQAKQVYLQDNGCYHFTLSYANQAEPVCLQVMGQHTISNALAAAALALAAGMELANIATALSAFQPVQGRMHTVTGINGSRIIDDSYNANPGSMKAAITVLSELPGQTLLVMGDMAELGEQGPALHAEIGRYAAQAGITGLLGLGPLSQLSVQSFQQAGGEQAVHVRSHQALLSALTCQLQPDVTVLVKGSRSAAMEQVVQQLIEEG